LFIKWNERQLETLKKMDISMDVNKDLNDDDLDLLYEVVPDYMLAKSEGDPDDPKSEWNVCEDIITILGQKMDERGLLATSHSEN